MRTDTMLTTGGYVALLVLDNRTIWRCDHTHATRHEAVMCGHQEYVRRQQSASDASAFLRGLGQ